MNRSLFVVSGRTAQLRTFSTASASKNIGFIGLGQMGSRMAPHLAIKGNHKLHLLDANAEAVSNVIGKVSSAGGSAVQAKSLRQIAEECDVIITMLPSSPHVREVYTGNQGLLSIGALRDNALLIDTSTIDPATAKEVSAEVTKTSASALMLDAPVSGGIGGAEAGTLTFMVGANTEPTFEQASNILKHMGKNIVHCGGVGTGQVAKICNNLVLGISMIAVSEAMVLGTTLGMDPAKLAGIFNTSSGRCWSSDTYNPYPGVMPNVPSSRGYTGGFGSDLMLKDLGLAVNAAAAAKTPLPMGGVAQQVYQMLSAKGLGGKDFSVVLEFLKRNQ